MLIENYYDLHIQQDIYSKKFSLFEEKIIEKDVIYDDHYENIMKQNYTFNHEILTIHLSSHHMFTYGFESMKSHRSIRAL